MPSQGEPKSTEFMYKLSNKAENMHQDKFIELNGIRMHYKEWGNKSDPDVLLIHGWTSNSESWTYIAEQIQDKYHVVAPDHRGHGASTKPVTGYRLRDFVEDMRQLIDALELSRPLIAGNSWGGCIGTILAADYPNSISKAVLGDPVYWKMLNAFVTRLPGIVERRQSADQQLAKDLDAQGMTKEQILTKMESTNNFSLDAITRLLSDNRDFAFTCEDYLKRIRIPTLIIAGDAEAGGYILPEELDHYRRIVPDMVRITQWPGIGHGVASQEPDKYVKEMLSFFQE